MIKVQIPVSDVAKAYRLKEIQIYHNDELREKV